MKYIIYTLTLLCSLPMFALSIEDINFLLDKEQYQHIRKHEQSILAKAHHGNEEDVKAILKYAQRDGQTGLAIECNFRLATEFQSLDAALEWISITNEVEMDSMQWESDAEAIISSFESPLDKAVLNYYIYGTDEASISFAVALSTEYNSVIESMAKGIIDEISVQRSDSLALAYIDEFYHSFPHSRYRQIAYYYQLYHLSNRQAWEQLNYAISEHGMINPVMSYIAALYLISPTYRKSGEQFYTGLTQALELLHNAENAKSPTLLYDDYTKNDWISRIDLQKAKIEYYSLIAKSGFYGDEKGISNLKKVSSKELSSLISKLKRISFSNNDRGELSEVQYWLGRAYQLNSKYRKQAARSYIQCLIWGSPRKKYDNEAWEAITSLHKELKIKLEPMQWARSLMKYKGIVFEDRSEDAGLNGKGYSRVAMGDYNSDGLLDLLFNGKYLYANQDNMSFADSTVAANLQNLNSNGGLFADFNRDGMLDILSLSHAEDSLGDRLMKNQGNKHYVSVNERAGDIDDRYPTEAAAWIDLEQNGYPSIYMANYEKWQVKSGYPDFYWKNDMGYFSNKSTDSGILFPYYTTSPAQAGRGVAPADFDNDGIQEILVTNYRLNRNFCWKQVDTLFVDVAPLYGLRGNDKQGYFGHSIGADWSDIDNDGDLDLFIANLAHPRFLDISDTSMLLRNDGLQYRVIEGDSIYFWQFTDITKSAGISYDELHSDPLFIDADNDGYPDLFITSIYENDRSYFYRNNGDGTFTDITWLAGARVYNGWGNAAGDLDRDGLLDIVVGSGSGTRVLHNRTKTKNKSVMIKPVWADDEIVLSSNPSEFGKLPQSPAFGTRVVLSYREGGKVKELIRELSSAKGTASQNASELHFGIGRGKLIGYRRFTP